MSPAFHIPLPAAVGPNGGASNCCLPLSNAPSDTEDNLLAGGIVLYSTPWGNDLIKPCYGSLLFQGEYICETLSMGTELTET